jgi:hypothetical protein
VPAIIASSISRTDTLSARVATLDSSGPSVLQDLVEPLDLPGPLLDLRLAVAGQVPQLPDRAGRHEAGADHAVLHQLAQPRRIRQVGLAAG